jgi:hypothetical protein
MPSPSAPVQPSRTNAWWVRVFVIAGTLLSALAMAFCLSRAHTTIWLPPRQGEKAAIPQVLTNGSMLAWGVAAGGCALVYALAAVFAFTRGLSTKWWFPLVCLAFAAVAALWAGMRFDTPVG